MISALTKNGINYSFLIPVQTVFSNKKFIHLPPLAFTLLSMPEDYFYLIGLRPRPFIEQPPLALRFPARSFCTVSLLSLCNNSLIIQLWVDSTCIRDSTRSFVKHSSLLSSLLDFVLIPN